MGRERLRSRTLAWPGCGNVRDIGGLPTVAGGRTRTGVVVRADSLDRLTPAGVSAVRSGGVGRILDLRSVWEFPEQPHPFGGDPVYRHVPFIDDSRDHERDRAAERTRADLYRGSIDRNVRQVAAVVAAVAEAPVGTVVVHCLAGVDRTGMLVAILLDLVGVHRSAIADDYASSPLSPSVAGPETITELLDHIDRVHGGVRAYLTDNGVSVEQLTVLRERLV